jgi:hypothetical protein
VRIVPLLASAPEMRRERREQLRDENLGHEHCAALYDIAAGLRDLHRETRSEINPRLPHHNA